MSAHRFFLKHMQPKDGIIHFPADIAHQISRVLRLDIGETVTVLDGEGKAFQVELSEVIGDQVSGAIIKTGEAEIHMPVKITLFFPLSKREKVEWILQKGTEVGVSVFQPFVSARSLVQDVSLPAKKRLRWESIIREAAEQSGRAFLPHLNDPQDLSQLLASGMDQDGLDAALVASVSEQKNTLSAMLHLDHLRPGQAIGLFIGAEGGFSDQELFAFQSQDIPAVSLGVTILRMETASIVFPALVLHLLSERFRSE